MRKIVLISAAMAALSLAGGANAAQYLLNVDNCTNKCIATPGGNDGTITVTNIAGGLHFSISLGTNIFFNQAGAGHDAFSAMFSGNPTVTFQNFSDTDLGGTTENPTSDFGVPVKHSSPDLPPLTEDGTASFNGMGYGFDYVGTPMNNGSIVPTSGIKVVSFDVIGSGLTAANNGGTPPIYFLVDLARTDSSVVPYNVVATGVVGATLIPGGVPEPASWALMILGFGGVGAVLRSRRQGRSATA